MATKKRKQKQTLKEFKAWLEGVEELQPDNWSPNYEQWLLIRSRIDGIKEAVTPAIETSHSTKPLNVPIQNPVIYQQPSAFTAPLAGGIPQGEVEMTVAAKRMLTPGAGHKAKTPDVDTSDGNIESTFA